MAPSLSLFSINALLILTPPSTSTLTPSTSSSTSHRVYTNYFTPPHTPASSGPFNNLKSQLAFESGLLEKTTKTNSDVILYDNHVVIYKAEADVILYVVGSVDENEMLLYAVAMCWRDVVNGLLKNATDKRTIIENYDLITLGVEEMVDDGVVLETDPSAVIARVSKPPQQDLAGVKGLDLSEQGLLNAWEFGKKQLQERLRQGL